jgi:hypothetical protein
MGRRNEPKLDELKRLLKRLETMEVDSKLEGSRNKSPAEVTQPATGYVGALRGAVSVDETDTRGPAAQHTSTYDSYDDEELPRPTRSGQRSSGPASVVLGAATAAVVSSVVAIGLVLYTADKDKGGDVSNRLSFVAPPESAAPASRPVASEQHGNTQTLLQNADIYIRRGNLGEARRSLEEAAKLGSGVAALTLGAMYDPSRVAEFGNLGVKADPTLARAWYERAKSLGVVEATERLQELAAR